MAVLTNKSIASTYKSVLSIGATTESALTTSIQQLTDGLGNSSPLSMSTTQIQFNNDANTFSFPADRGTSGQILKLADANGTLSWADDDLSNTLDFSGGTGTGSVTLDSQVLAFTGTANQIETSASSQAITLSFPTAGVTLPDGSIATTQSPSDNSTKVATTEYVEAAVSAGGDVTKTGTITANQIAVWNDSTNELRSDETVTIGTDHSITLYQPNTNSITTNYIIGGGSSMTTGELNTGFGSSVLTLNTTGIGNIAIGSDSLTTNVSGNNNVAVGVNTLKRTTASNNVAIGNSVLQFDTTGYENTAIGGLSQYNITTAYGNTSLGYNSLIFNSTGIQNTAIGWNSLKGLSTYSASNNTALGSNSGSAITTGSNNVIIGSNTGSTIATSSSNIIISDGSGTIRQSFDFTGAATFNGAATFSGTTSANVVISRDNMFVGTGQFYIGAENSTTSNTYRQEVGSGIFKIKFNNGGTWTDRLTISSGGAATFSSSVTASGGYYYGQSTNSFVRLDNTIGSQIGYNNYAYSLYDSNGVSFYTAANATPTLKLNISSGGDVTITQPTNGNNAVLNLTAKSAGGNTRTTSLTYDANTEKLIINNAGTEILKMGSSTGVIESNYGIKFGTGATLDAYEEGTWTPTNQGTSNMTTAPSSFSGTYTRIGNRVTCDFKMSGLTAPYTGALIYIDLGGFPFPQNPTTSISNGTCINYPNSRQTGGVRDGGSAYADVFQVFWQNTASTQSNATVIGTITYQV
jgi:hypothetical protein